MTIHDMQNLNRAAMEHLLRVITPGMALREVRQICEEYLLAHGADSFWYYDIGAFVFRGEETALSLSGREYRTPDSVIEENDIVTVDLSPQYGGIWGDFARTIILEEGRVITDIQRIRHPEWRAGLLTEDVLHAAMRDFVRADATFEELFFHINDRIKAAGFINLDFLGNLGHSIENERSRRIYIERGNRTRLADVTAFTFEPHIGLPGSRYGFKKENIYCFADGRVAEV